jgi:phosphohistidine phosphatase
MKKLYLIRHAKASWDNPDQPDYDRPLTELGEKDCHAMAMQLKEQKTVPDKMISSSAARAMKTAEIFAEVLNFPEKKIVSDIHIYTGGVEELVSMIKAFDAKLNTVFIFGHNPSLTLLAHFLCEGLRMTITTCGVLSIGFDMKNWEDIVETEGKLLAYDHPHHEFPDAHEPQAQEE